MNAAKLRLSEEEAALMKNANWILTKNRVMDNMRDWMTELQKQYQSELNVQSVHFPKAVLDHSHKISRGENFKGLPYMVLDYPRYFSKTDTLAIRTLFWWGRYFSSTLQLSGDYLERFNFEQLSWLENAGLADLYIATGPDPWDHDLDSGNYREIKSMEWQEIKKVAFSIGYLKIVAKISLDEWEPAGLHLNLIFKQFAALIGASYLSDEKGL